MYLLSRIAIAAGITGLGMCPGQTAQNGSEPLHIGDVTISGSLRSRVEVWNWFAGTGNNEYALSDSIFRLSFQQSKQTYDWNIEVAAPVLLGLPRNSVGPGAQGQLGMGGSYFAANGSKSNAASLFAKQAYLAFKFQSGTVKQRLQLGRSQFTDGGETVPKDATLAAVKRDRIAQRLLASFGFSDVGRSFDGIQYVASSGATNLTFAAVRPTRGVFQTDGWGEININAFYGALTRETGRSGDAGEWRVFAMGYNDQRDAVLKVDNRPQSLRSADRQHIAISTFGGHYLGTMKTGPGTADFLFWAAAQAGSWGTLAQRSTAFAAEAGWQPAALRRIKPWVRGGYDYGSGDGNPNDKTHGTFFQMLPTPRIYARFPFYNMMNNRDTFAQVMLRPAKAVTLRSDVHQLGLASSKDLWYSGGGAYQPWTFGYTGRPSNGHSGLARLYDISAEWRVSKPLSATLYYGHAEGSSLTAAIYSKEKSADFGYVELNLRF